MAVAVKPSPPSRIAVAVRLFVHFVLSSMPPAFERVLLVAARALAYLCIVTSWVFSTGSAATVVARHACPDGSALLVFLEELRGAAYMACLCISAVLLCGLCVSLAVVASESGQKSKKSAFGAIGLESTQGFKLPRAVILGSVACLPYTLLTVAGFLVMMMSSPVEGSVSQGEIIGSVIMDVGRFGIHAISSLVIFPALAGFMEADQLDRTLVENGPLVPVLEGL